MHIYKYNTDIEQLGYSSVVPGAAAGRSGSQIVEVPCGNSIWHFLLRRHVRWQIQSAGNKQIHEGTSSSVSLHFNSNHTKQRKQSQQWFNLHMRLVEIAFPPGLMDHLTSKLLPRMLWADVSDPHAAVWCGNTGDGGHKATVR